MYSHKSSKARKNAFRPLLLMKFRNGLILCAKRQCLALNNALAIGIPCVEFSALVTVRPCLVAGLAFFVAIFLANIALEHDVPNTLSWFGKTVCSFEDVVIFTN